MSAPQNQSTAQKSPAAPASRHPGGIRLARVKFRESIQLPVSKEVTRWDERDMIDVVRPKAREEGKWNIIQDGPFVYVWHEDAPNVVMVPMSMVRSMVPLDA